MKESKLFLAFLKRNLLILLLPIILGLLISVFFYSNEVPKTKIFQAFKMESGPDNQDQAFALTDQAVTELRLQGFDIFFPGSQALIYKPGPLAVGIEIMSLDKNQGYELLLKETAYLRKNFTVSTLTSPEITQIEPSVFRFLLTGVLIGFLIGLLLSLVKEYFANY